MLHTITYNGPFWRFLRRLAAAFLKYNQYYPVLVRYASYKSLKKSSLYVCVVWSVLLEMQLALAVCPTENLPLIRDHQLYVFVSLSQSKHNLIEILTAAKRHNAQVVLRGFKEGSYQKTVKELTEITTKANYGVIIHPELFKTYNIRVVPSFVLVKADDKGEEIAYDKLAGNVSLRFVLEEFVKKGDLKTEAKQCLEEGS